ncbi:MAG: hypothetical protein QQN63_00075 [Nitrosopumilus sp.]
MSKKYKSTEEMYTRAIQPFLPDDTVYWKDVGWLEKIEYYLLYRKNFK